MDIILHFNYTEIERAKEKLAAVATKKGKKPIFNRKQELLF